MVISDGDMILPCYRRSFCKQRFQFLAGRVKKQFKRCGHNFSWRARLQTLQGGASLMRRALPKLPTTPWGGKFFGSLKKIAAPFGFPANPNPNIRPPKYMTRSG